MSIEINVCRLDDEKRKLDTFDAQRELLAAVWLCSMPRTPHMQLARAEGLDIGRRCRLSKVHTHPPREWFRNTLPNSHS